MAFMDGADIIESFDPEAITLLRYGAPTVTNSRAVKPAATNVSARFVIWPSSGREIRLLPEGFRTFESITFVTVTPLQENIDPDNAYPDEFVYRGSTWSIQAADNWGAKAGYYMGVAVKLVT